MEAAEQRQYEQLATAIVARILPIIMPMVGEGLITVEPVEIVLYRHRDQG